ncbi:MAG: alpha/beta hydrolase [Myxococcota bacterium]|nr:alpha/beta hydrolase [Myxococcota bacterium]
MTGEELHFDVDEGRRLAADALGSPNDPPVVLLHGGGQTRHSWSETAQALAAAGWYAVSVDLRGHGESDWSPTGDYSPTRFANDVTRLARAFDEPPVLVGASLGGISSLLAVGTADTEARPLARALVLVDIATQVEPDGADRIVSFMESRPDGFASLQEAADAVALYNPHRKPPRNLDGLAKNLRKHADGRYRWHWDPAFLKRRHFSADSLTDPMLLDRAARGLTIPTLLVRGRLSDLLSQEGAEAFLEQVPHAKFADVSGAGHMVAGDQNDLFADAVLGFLSAEL